jgi:hypothetical protein
MTYDFARCEPERRGLGGAGGATMKTAMFRAFPRWLLIGETLLALVATPTGVVSLVGGETFQGLLLIGLGMVNGIGAAVQSQQRLTISDAGLSLPTGFRPTSVDWAEVSHIHLDWSAASGGGDRQVFRVERRERGTLGSGVPMGMGSTQRDHARLEQALHQRAEAHGFEFEVTDPRWGQTPPHADRSD